MKYFDTHCHLNGKFYSSNIEEDFNEALKEGVDKILLPGTTIEDSLKAIEMSKNNNHFYAAAGLHPSDADENDLHYLEKIDPKDIVAVGEVGIDLYREENSPLEVQKKVFKTHIEFAIKHNKPVIVHMRESEEEVYEIIRQYPNLKFIMHSFTSTVEWAKKFVALGGLISISGIVTFKNAQSLKEVVKEIPLESLLTETDAPFLTPVPFRGKNNKPEYVRFVAHEIANIKNIEIEKVTNQLYKNALNVFNID